METTPLELIDFAEFLADEAGKICRLYYRGQLGVQNKADNTPVTEADRKIEETIRKLVEINFPDHVVYGEEMANSEVEAKYTWVIDPIDGTKSFITGRPLFGTLISLVENGQPIIGVIDQPVISERWVAANNATKFNNKIVQTRGGITMDQAIFATTSPFLFSEKDKFIVAKISEATNYTIYGGDCYSYGQLAMGLVDVIVESGLKPYDFLALVPVIENAGGKITDWQGNTLTSKSDGNILACGDVILHKQILKSYFC